VCCYKLMDADDFAYAHAYTEECEIYQNGIYYCMVVNDFRNKWFI